MLPMPRTLFLFATEGEAARFRQLRPDALIEVVGVGMAEAAAGAAEYVARYAPQRVVLAGIAGACGKELRVGECVVVVSDCVAALPETYRVEYSGREWGNLPRVASYTVNRTGENLSLSYFAGRDLPAIEQMEGAAVAAVCRRTGVEYLHLRAISNRVTDKRTDWRIGEAINSLTTALVEYCNQNL